MIEVLLVIQVIVCIFLISVILLQKSQSDSLSGLGTGNNMNFMSSQFKSSALTKMTTIFAAIFMINCLLLGNIMSRNSESKKIDRLLDKIENNQEESVIVPEVD